jgi:WD40 repeat protein
MISLFRGLRLHSWHRRGVLALLVIGGLGLWLFIDTITHPHLLQTFTIDHSVSAVALSPDGQIVAAAGLNRSDPHVYVWQIDEPKVRYTIPLTCYASALAIHPQGHILSVATNDGGVTFWDLRTGTVIRQVIPPQPWPRETDKCTTTINMSDSRDIYDSVFDAQGRFLAVSGASGVNVIEVSTGTQVAAFHGHPNPEYPEGVGAPIWDVAFRADGQLLASAGGDGTVHLWTIPEGTLTQVIVPTDLRYDANVVAFCRNEPCLRIAFGRRNRIETWSLPDGQRLAQVEPEPWSVSRAFSPDGELVARSDLPDDIGLSLFPDTNISVYTIHPWREHLVLRGHRHVVTHVQFSVNARMLVSGDRAGKVMIWQLE